MPDRRYELADFNPSDGHLHGCRQGPVGRSEAWGAGELQPCDCAALLYAIAQDAAMATPQLGTVVKLASLVVHAQELQLGQASAPFDVAAITSLAHDPDVVAWLATVDPAFLPAKRNG